jgi:hypothetical protein
VSKLKVQRRDGVWLAIGERGAIRYAGADWTSAISFALMAYEKPIDMLAMRIEYDYFLRALQQQIRREKEEGK